MRELLLENMINYNNTPATRLEATCTKEKLVELLHVGV